MTGLKLRYAFAWSLALHGALVVPWLLGGLWMPEPSQPQALELDLFGMVSDRQLEERQTAVEAPSQVAPTPKKPAPEKKESPPPPQKAPPPPQPSPVEVTTPAVEPASPPEQQLADTQTPLQNTPASAASESDDVSQKQQSANTPEQAEALRRYLASLSKAIQSRLSYPAEARKDRMMGSPIVSFHLDEAGYIRSGSLEILRSSGYTLLDRKALEAAQASVPFAPPPRAMDVAIAVSFGLAARKP